ncbi:single hybrid motif-containing protein [Pluteus cervinus]|uniref:Single hybrid motif-containing protein n=1 Tax=Pluteus cervinus TaxID=181527 RepID=A0ACD3A2F2_9AGAR|nr:single hybrid motif-containing protein [Pluteus cervinus]
MASRNALVRTTRLLAEATRHTHRRAIHHSSVRYAITNMEMPAMSPTMTEGGIAGWKKKEGEAFTAGDVLLEIETDKATIDVEAQEDGVLGKIILPDGSKNVPVGKVIALLAEEGDDVSNLQPPEEPQRTAAAPAAPQPASSPTPSEPSKPASAASTSSTQHHSHFTPTHTRPLFPSVHRLLIEHNITNAESITGTGVRGMLTKGDVLTFLGKASGPTGTYKERPAVVYKPEVVAKEEPKALDGPALRRTIVANMLSNSLKPRGPPIPAPVIDFDSILADYLHPSQSTTSTSSKPVEPSIIPAPVKSSTGYFDGLI